MQEYGDPLLKDRLMKQLFAMKMRSGETAVDYSRRFRLLAYQAGLADYDASAVHLLIAELPELTRFMIHTGQQTGQLVKQPTISNIHQFLQSLPVASSHHAAAANTGRVSSAVGSVSTAAPTPRHATKFCTFHERSGHSTEQCRDRKAASRQTTPSTPSAAVQATPSKPPQIRCYNCGKTGHYSNNCRDPVRQQQLQLTYVTDEPAPPAPPAAEPTETLELRYTSIDQAMNDSVRPYTVPILVNGHKALAFVDTGAEKTFIAQELVHRIDVKVNPTHGRIQTVVPHISLARVGCTAPLQIQFGQREIEHACEVLAKMDDVQIIIGRDLIPKLQINVFGLPYEYPGTEAPEQPLDDMPPSLVTDQYTAEESTPAFRAARDHFLTSIHSALEGNKAVPFTAACTLPESIVYLETPPDKAVYRRQYTVANRMKEPMSAVINQWLADGVIELAPVDTTFNTPIFPIPKKDPTGKKTLCRPCLDFRPLNALLPDDTFPLPRIGDIFTALAGAKAIFNLGLTVSISSVHYSPRTPT